MKCIVENCSNSPEGGRCIILREIDPETNSEGDLYCICVPCWQAMFGNKKSGIEYTQIYRNMLEHKKYIEKRSDLEGF